MPRVPDYKIEEYTYRHLTDDGFTRFGEWLGGTSFQDILSSSSVDEAVGLLHAHFERGINHSFELKTRKKKTSEPEWMADWLRDDIEDRRKVFHTDEGRSQRWKAMKKKTAAAVKKRRSKLNAHIIDKFKNESNPGKFFHHVKCLLGKNSNNPWSPTLMYPGLNPEQVADRLAEFFNGISSQYSPLDIGSVPKTFDRELPTLTATDIQDRLKKVKKPTSVVPGDIPSAVFSKHPAVLSPPIAHIFNLITSQKQWPKEWKKEYVTIIPKTACPTDPSECRNISCTNFLSKLYESFVLQWCREEVTPKLNQYGGEPGASSTQLLVEVLSDVTSTLEDNRAASVLSSLDFSKAFNRLEHTRCLCAFAKKGLSNGLIALLGSFLTERLMSVRVGGKSSDPRPINAGAPQGSVLGCYLFNIGIDDLEDGFDQSEPSPIQAEAHDETQVRSDDFPAMSTPSRVGAADIPTESPIAARETVRFSLLPGVANVPHWIQKPKDPIFNEGSIKTLKYVDDEINCNKVNMRKARLLIEDGVFFKEIVDLRTQRLLQHIADCAENRGMVINAKKTGLMLVSAATSFEARVRVQLGNETIKGSDHLKILGVTLDSDATFRSHAEALARRMRSRTWALSKLKKRGLGEKELVKAYKCLIRPTAEYASPAWHSCLTATQAASVERQQTQALKNIYGPGLSACKMRIRADVDLLSVRRERAAKKFALKNLNNPRCQSWFQQRNPPSYARRSNVSYPKYREETARTDRHRNTPKNFLIRKLNEP